MFYRWMKVIMIIGKSIIMLCATWFINILFWAGFIPQILLNFKLKSTKGLSDLTLLCFFNGYITYTYYVLCLSLPLAFKIMSPLSLVLVLVMVFQRFIYEDGYKKDKKLLTLFVVNGLLALLLAPYAFTKTLLVGGITGWVATMIWFVLAFPQMFKVHLKKSVVGFSFLLVSLVGFGDIVQVVIALVMGLPVQSLINGLRGILIFSIFCVQFWLYKDNKALLSMKIEPSRKAEDGLLPPTGELNPQPEQEEKPCLTEKN